MTSKKKIALGTFLTIAVFLAGDFVLDISDAPIDINYDEFICKDSGTGGWCWKLIDPTDVYPDPYRGNSKNSAASLDGKNRPIL